MKKDLICLTLFLFSLTAFAQDTIFVKTGEKIPAIIVSKDNTEIKYKKYGQPEPAAIYSVFVSDLKSIHFSDGIVADYTAGNENPINRPKRPVDLAGTMGIGKISFGVNAYYFKRNASDDLFKFWQINPLLHNNTSVLSATTYYPIELRMSFVIGQARRNWIGTGLELIFTPPDAIYAINTDKSDEIRLKMWYYNIPLYYGHTINHKKNLIAIFEPALNLAFMSGNIKINNVDHTLVSNLGSGMNLGVGVDWIISKRLHASARVGQRFMKVKESHKSDTSSTGYSSFYVNPAAGDQLLTIKWNGPYATAGLYWSMYFKMKGFKAE
jgi:hypothetical protein